MEITIEITEKMVVEVLKECIESEQQEIDEINAMDNPPDWRLEDQEYAEKYLAAAQTLLEYYGVKGIDF